MDISTHRSKNVPEKKIKNAKQRKKTWQKIF